MKRTAAFLAVLQLIGWMLLYPALAVAQTAPGGGIGAIAQAAQRTDDQSRQALVAVFGEVVNNPLASSSTGGGDTLLASIFQSTNAALLTIGGVICGWGVFRKVAGAASSGNLFEQGGMWGPLRVVWGVSSLVPTANGWSMAQLVMLWAASVMGVGTANLAVDGAAAALQSGKPLVMQPVANATLDVARQLFAADLCMEGINYGLAEVANTGGGVDNSEYINQQPVTDGGGFALTDGHQTYSCGGAYIDASQLQPQQQSTSLLNWNTVDVSAIYQAHANALAAMQAMLDAAAKQYVAAVIATHQGQQQTIPSAEASIQSAAATYEGTVQAAVGEKIGDISQLSGQLVNNIKDQGWWMLGSWYQTFAQANQKLSDAVAAKASIAAPSPMGAPGPTEIWQSALAAFHTEEASPTAAPTLGTPASAAQSIAQAGSVNAVVKTIFSPGQSLLRNVLNATQTSSNDTQVNPLITLKNMGDKVMGMAELAFTSMAGVDALIAVKEGWSVEGLAAKVANGATGVGDLLIGAYHSAHPYLFLVVLGLFLFGVTLSVVIPMTPFMIWIGALANWLVVVGEGIVAAPLWALAHLGAEGEGLGQRSMHGYLFLLNMSVRPFLMVIGFFLGGGTLMVIGTFAIPAFELAMANAQADSITGLVTILAYLYLFVQMFLALTARCFNLIMLLPDTVLNWIGAQATQKLGFEAEHVHSGFDRGKQKAGDVHEKGGPISAPKGVPDNGNGFDV